jgi:hypothetical protein
MMTDTETVVLANKILIKAKFDKEFASFGHYIKSDLKKSLKAVNALIDELSVIEFKAIAVELAPSDVIHFKIALDDKRLLSITKPFHEIEDMRDDQIIFMIFILKDCVYSDVMDIKDLTDGINKYIAEVNLEEEKEKKNGTR